MSTIRTTVTYQPHRRLVPRASSKLRVAGPPPGCLAWLVMAFGALVVKMIAYAVIGIILVFRGAAFVFSRPAIAESVPDECPSIVKAYRVDFDDMETLVGDLDEYDVGCANKEFTYADKRVVVLEGDVFYDCLTNTPPRACAPIQPLRGFFMVPKDPHPCMFARYRHRLPTLWEDYSEKRDKTGLNKEKGEKRGLRLYRDTTAFPLFAMRGPVITLSPPPEGEDDQKHALHRMKGTRPRPRSFDPTLSTPCGYSAPISRAAPSTPPCTPPRRPISPPSPPYSFTPPPTPPRSRPGTPPTPPYSSTPPPSPPPSRPSSPTLLSRSNRWAGLVGRAGLPLNKMVRMEKASKEFELVDRSFCR